jgi:hypothetical protein
MRGWIVRVVVLWTLCCSGASWPGAASAQCLKDTREAAFGDAGKAAVVTYLCKAAEQQSPSVRVEFHRLSEAAAAGVLAGAPWPEVTNVLGKVRLLDNATRREALGLYQKFGITEEREDSFHFQAFAAQGGTASEKVSAGTGRRKFTYLTYPDTEGLTGQTLALPEADTQIRTTSTWPPDMAFYYGGEECKPGNYACITLWRYFNADDVSRFEDRWKKQQAITAIENPDNQFPAVDENGNPLPTPGSAPLKLISHLTRNGWPEDFIVAVGSYNQCGGGYDFSYYPRQMILDAAVVQNISTKPQTVGELLGSQVESTDLRPPAPAMRGVVAAGIVPIPGAVGKLAPGERVLVPLRMTFVAPKGLAANFTGKLADARKLHAAYQALPPGTVVKETMEGVEKPLAKPRESFLAPALPKVTSYTWGPEITLKGLMVDGQRIILEETSANFLELTAGDGYGSCPYLYAYDADKRTWINHGKVIDKADSASKETTEDVPMSKFTTRFRLREEELELSHINRVALHVDMKDGSRLVLAPDDPRLASKDDRYVQILAGRLIDFAFALPKGVSEADVATSKLSITGYYRRYSALKLVTNATERSD